MHGLYVFPVIQPKVCQSFEKTQTPTSGLAQSFLHSPPNFVLLLLNAVVCVCISIYGFLCIFVLYGMVCSV